MFAESFAGFDDNKRLGNFTSGIVRNRNYGSISNVRVLEENSLQLRRGYLIAIAFEHFLQPVFHKQIAIFVAKPEI